MGIYLNPGPQRLKMARASKIYVDKSEIIAELNEVIATENRFVCVSRPRRFGKSMAVAMIGAYYDRTVEASSFDGLKIAGDSSFPVHQGQYDVLRINMQEFLSRAKSMEEMLARLTKKIGVDLKRAYPDTEFFDENSLSDMLEDVYGETGRLFVVLIDEWDCIFREYKEAEAEQRQYLDFLRDLLKDKEYIALAYMTGILPIKKYGTHSALNMFTEYSMESPGSFAPYVGFTEEEVRALCEANDMSFSECRAWYDGYRLKGVGSVYSPRSVVQAMMSHEFGSYWTKTETYEALKIYIDMNFDGLSDTVARLMGGERVPIDTQTFQNDMTTFHGADDVLTLLIHLGYLMYDQDKSEVAIPNNEILGEYVTATKRGERWDLVRRALEESDALLGAILAGDEARVAEGLERAHLETSHIKYNDENALSCTLSLALYTARKHYNVIRELPTGKGFADLVFLPRPMHGPRPAILAELKWDESAETAIRQIKEKKYLEALKDYAGEVILAGICYNKKTRVHTCRIEKVML